MTEVLKNPKTNPDLSCLALGLPTLFHPVSQEVGVELLLEQQGCCGFAYKLPLK